MHGGGRGIFYPQQNVHGERCNFGGSGRGIFLGSGGIFLGYFGICLGHWGIFLGGGYFGRVEPNVNRGAL